MNLFEKIAKIDHSLSDQLTEGQQNYLQKLIDKMNLARAECKNALAFVNSIIIVEENELIDSHSGHIDWVENLKLQRDKIVKNSFSKARQYLNSQFLLEVAIDDSKGEDITELEGFLRIYFDEGKLSSLDGASRQKIKDELTGRNGCTGAVIYYRDRFKAAGFYLTIKERFQFDFPWSNTGDVKVAHNYRDEVRKLIKALSLFETDDIRPVNYIKDLFVERDQNNYEEFIVRFAEKKEINIEGTILQSIQWYKNGSLKLGFKDKLKVAEFIAYFKLDKLEKSRW